MNPDYTYTAMFSGDMVQTPDGIGKIMSPTGGMMHKTEKSVVVKLNSDGTKRNYNHSELGWL